MMAFLNTAFATNQMKTEKNAVLRQPAQEGPTTIVTFEGKPAEEAFKALNNSANKAAEAKAAGSKFDTFVLTDSASQGILFAYGPSITCRFNTLSSKYDCSIQISDRGLLK